MLTTLPVTASAGMRRCYSIECSHRTSTIAKLNTEQIIQNGMDVPRKRYFLRCSTTKPSITTKTNASSNFTVTMYHYKKAEVTACYLFESFSARLKNICHEDCHCYWNSYSCHVARHSSTNSEITTY